MKTQTFLLGCVVAVLSLLGSPAFAGQKVVVNGKALGAKQIKQLEQAYRTQIHGGKYWYDDFSGLWGYQGGPAAGQIHPGLRLGGRLKANASGGGTGVYVNGREIHKLEYAYLLRTYGTVQRGRYWVNATGVGGFEGGPAFFNLRASSGNQKRSLTGGYSVTGGVLGGGGVVGYTNSNGVGITCGPDGGCF